MAAMCQVQAAQPGKRDTWTSLVGQPTRFVQICHAPSQTDATQAWCDSAKPVLHSMRSINVTGAQMVLTLKMISAAVCYHDGLMPAQVCSAFDPMPHRQDAL